MKKILYKLIDRLFLFATAGLVLLFGYFIYENNFSDEAFRREVYRVYDQLWTNTGMAQDKLPLKIVDNPIINAYNTGNEIVIYTGLLDTLANTDELALVLGHEIAHGTLWHLRMMAEWEVLKTDYDVTVLESNADKLGAIYMMKAGYDVCTGRKLFYKWGQTSGDYLGGNHPGYAYRYSQLNINCD